MRWNEVTRKIQKRKININSLTTTIKRRWRVVLRKRPYCKIDDDLLYITQLLLNMLSFWCKLLIKKRQRNVKDGNVHSLMWSNYIKRRTKNGARWKREEWFTSGDYEFWRERRMLDNQELFSISSPTYVEICTSNYCLSARHELFSQIFSSTLRIRQYSATMIKKEKKKQQKIRVDYKLEIILVTIGIL